MFRFDCQFSLSHCSDLYKKLFNLICDGVMVNGVSMASSVVYAVIDTKESTDSKTIFNYFAVIDDTDEIYQVDLKEGVSTALKLSGRRPEESTDLESWIQFLHTSGLVFASGCEYIYEVKDPIPDVNKAGIRTSPYNMYQRKRLSSNLNPFASNWYPITDSHPPISDKDYYDTCYHDKETSMLYTIDTLCMYPSVAKRFREDYERHVASTL